MRGITFLGVLIFLITPVAYASSTIGTTDSAYKYAWSNVGGYVNFAPSQGGITITDTGITGYAWSANFGWINFDTNLSGVTNDGEGNLGGFAWGEGAGWISFSGVTIDDSGHFQGQSVGGAVNGASYTITFDCANCDVRTDWRPVSVRGGIDDENDGDGNGSSVGSVTTSPDTEFPTEPTTSPLSAPEPNPSITPGVVPDTGHMAPADTLEKNQGVEGIPVVYPSGDLANPSASDTLDTGESSSTPVSSKRSVIVSRTAIFFVAVFFLIFFLYRRRRAI